MDWMNQLGGILQQYTNSTQDRTQDAERDFDHITHVAPREALAGGLKEAFRSDQTPPFPNMLATLFSHSDRNQRADILNTLLSAAGPAMLSGATAQGGGILSQLGQLFGDRVTPEMADQVGPDTVQTLAEQAERTDPGILDHISDFYAAHPQIVKSLGAAALTVAMSGLARRR